MDRFGIGANPLLVDEYSQAAVQRARFQGYRCDFAVRALVSKLTLIGSFLT
jgi:hypothetical protein